mgnify:CR=1 FL=1
MGKKQRIERLERMLSGSNGEVQTYEPYKGVFADLEEHHSRLKAVEHDVPELIRTVDRLLERVGALERDAAEVAARDITLTTEKFPFIASTADVEDVPGAGEVRSESHLWMHKGEIDAEVSRIEAEDAQPRQRASSPPSASPNWQGMYEGAEARIKELEAEIKRRDWERERLQSYDMSPEEANRLRDEVEKLTVGAIDRDRTYKAALLSKNTVDGEDVYFWHRRYWGAGPKIGRFREG